MSGEDTAQLLKRSLPLDVRAQQPEACAVPERRGTTMRRVFSSYTSFEARLIAQLLAEHGVESEVRNESLNRVIGGVPLTESMVEVWVAEADVSRAEELVAEPHRRAQLAENDESGALAQCPTCGAQWEPGFERCWNCGYVTSA